MRGLKKQRRIQVIVIAFVALALSTALIGYAMRDGISFFFSPTQVAEDPPPEIAWCHFNGNLRSLQHRHCNTPWHATLLPLLLLSTITITIPADSFRAAHKM